jgi:PAS domain S-box-containing protein
MVKILVVEDELIVAMELKSRLGDLGYSVLQTVPSGEEAIKLVAEETPDIILMDINIKGAYDGIQTAEKIKAEYDIPVIFITAFADPQTLQRAKITEPYGYIIKPFEERELHTSIEIALYKHSMEKKLKSSEHRLAITLKSIGDAVIATDKDGVITYLNPAAEKLTCYSFNEAVGKIVFEVFQSKEHHTINVDLKNLIHSGLKKDFTGTTTITCKKDIERIIESNVSSIVNEKGEIEGIVLSFRDITERIRMQEELKIALNKAEESNRLKTLFLNNMSHEFRTPIAGIMGSAQMFKDAFLDEENKEIAEMMVTSSSRLLTTLDSILQFSQLEANKVEANPTEICTIDIIESLVNKYRKKIQKKGLELKLNLGDRKIAALIDEKLLTLALNNLADNALKFTNSGRIIFETGTTDINNKKWATIGITDTGIGIPGDKLNIIFDDFRQVSEGISREYDGNGLGLSIAKKIIEQMNGFITVESHSGKGSKFTIYLPYAFPNNGKSNKTKLPGLNKIHS